MSYLSQHLSAVRLRGAGRMVRSRRRRRALLLALQQAWSVHPGAADTRRYGVRR